MICNGSGLRSEFEANAKLQALLGPARYAGPLSGFLGRRWWRAAIESIVFNLTPNDPASVSALHDGLKEAAPGLISHGAGFLFPVLDAAFHTKDVLGTPDEVVEVVPDDWPPFADPAWALRRDLDDHPGLAAVAVADSAEGE